MAGAYYERVYGEKYNGKLTTTEIAKLVREEIKAEVKAGTLPKGKYSVRSSYFAGGSSIDARISNLAVDAVYNPEYVEAVAKKEDTGRYTFMSEIYTPEVQAVTDRVRGMLAAYNHDGSDSMTDYFDVKFYSHVTLDWSWTDPILKAAVEAVNNA